MTNHDNANDCWSALNLRDFNDRVADPDYFVGGGSVASATGASAVAITLLVTRLNRRRRANEPQFETIDAAVLQLEQLQERFYRHIDEDIRVLDRLLKAQRALKRGPDRNDFVSALLAAAQSPLDMARDLVRLLEVIAGQLALASRFTVSDLGAAATLSDGACRAALLTVDVNLALLSNEPGANKGDLAALHLECRQLRETSERTANSIELATRTAIVGSVPEAPS